MTLVDRARAGVVTSGHLVILGAAATKAAVTDIAARRFSWSEFLLQHGAAHTPGPVPAP